MAAWAGGKPTGGALMTALFLQVESGNASAGKALRREARQCGGRERGSDTREFNIQVSADERSSHGRGVLRRRLRGGTTEYRQIVYFDGRGKPGSCFVDGKVESRTFDRLLNFEEDGRMSSSPDLPVLLLRLAVFFGCLGMFMYLFRGEMPTARCTTGSLRRRGASAAPGKYAAGLIASTVIFGAARPARLCAMSGRTTRWNPGPTGTPGHGTRVLVCATAALAAFGYGSVLLAVGL